jgi:signal transduction histidine kinase
MGSSRISPTPPSRRGSSSGWRGIPGRNDGNVGVRARLEDLQRSRERLVAAQDEERRRIERNLHDGAQQQLIALAVKARLAQQLAERDTDKSASLLSDIQRDAGSALDDLRDLARGIYPPLLADQRLGAALEAQARKAPIRVTVDVAVDAQYPQAVEAAVCFCCLEALNNVAKCANATRASVRIARDNGQLRFEVADDGKGFDVGSTTHGTGLQGMADRLDALGGRFEVTSAPGTGTNDLRDAHARRDVDQQQPDHAVDGRVSRWALRDSNPRPSPCKSETNVQVKALSSTNGVPLSPSPYRRVPSGC